MFLISQAELTRLTQIQERMDALFRATCATLDAATLKQISTAHGELAFVIDRVTRKQVTEA